METYDLVVIGAGAAGLVTAAGASRLGAKVALIEKDRLGGECLWTGCVPSKAIIRSARVKHLIENAGSFGFTDTKVQVDFPRVMGHVKDVIMKIQPHDDPERFRKMGIEVIEGEAAFIGPDRVKVNDRTLVSGKFCIATGAGPLIPPIEGINQVPYLTHENFFDQTRQPEHLIVIGGGPIGCEMGQTFYRLGSRVTIVETLDCILNKDDHEVACMLHQMLLKEGVGVEVRARAVRAEHENGTIRLHCTRDGENFTVEGDVLLMATGKRPRVEGFGLDAAGVKYDKRGIQVDRTLKTTNSRIYACGDVSGGFPFTHTAEYEAGLVITNALIPLLNRKADYEVVPWATYTDPELAQVGLNEEQAKEKFGPKGYRVWRYEVKNNDRHIIEGETRGLVKLLTSQKGRIIGATILGASAGELIHEYAMVIKKKGTVTDISGMIHAYPTKSQANKRASDQYFSEKFFEGRIPKIVSWWLKRVRPKSN